MQYKKKQTEKEMTSEEIAQEKKAKKITRIAGVLLLLAAVFLFLGRSESFRHKLALLKSDADYFIYVEEKHLENTNDDITAWYSDAAKETQKYGGFADKTKVEITGNAMSVLKTYLDVNEMESTMEETRYLEHAQSELFGYLESFAGSDVVSSGKLKKLLEKYERILLEGFAEGTVTVTDDAKQLVGSRTASRRKIQVSLTKEQVDRALQQVTDELLKDKKVRKIYANMFGDEANYEEALNHTLEQILTQTCPMEMTLYVNNKGNITGREILVTLEEKTWRLGYGYVEGNADSEISVYAYQEENEIFLISGIGYLNKEALYGKFTVSAPLFLTQKLTVSVTDFSVMNLFRGRLAGSLSVSMEELADAELKLYLEANQEEQLIDVFVVYAGAGVLEGTIRLTQEFTAE